MFNSLSLSDSQRNNMAMEFAGKFALVTGGASGIGLEATKELLRNGVQAVTILDINSENGATALEAIKNEFGDGRACFIKTDVTVHGEFEDAFVKSIAKFGRLDIVINNAGIFTNDYVKVINVNLIAAIRCIDLSLKYMGKHNGGQGGVVLSTASICGLQVFAGCATYNASKHGVVGLVRSYGKPVHYDITGISHMAICPGVTETPILDALKIKDTYSHDSLITDINSYPKQTPDCCARSMIYMLKNGKNGSIWVSEGGSLFEVDIPERKDISKLVIQNI